MNSIQKSVLFFYKKNKAELFAAFISTFVFGLIAHAYGFLNNIFSHDSLNALYADDIENLAKVSVGRFLVPIVRLMRGSISLPWIIGLIGFTFIALSTFLIVKIFKIQSKFITILISGIMVTNVTVIASVATYVHEFDVNMLALMAAVLSVYIWSKKDNIISFALSAILMILSFSIYQSNITVSATIMIMVMSVNLINGSRFKDTFFKGVKGAAEIGIASGIYYAASKIIPAVMKIEAQSRTDVFNVSDSLSQNVSFFNSFNAMLVYEVEKIINPASVLPSVITACINVLLIFCGCCVAIFFIFRLGKGKIKEKILLLALFAMLPISIGFIEILTKGSMHEVMAFSFWLIPIFILLLIRKYDSVTEAGVKKFFKITAAICVIVTIWNNILVANTAYLKKDLEQQSTVAAMTRVVSDLEEFEGYSIGESKICFIGAEFLGNNMPGFDSVSKIEGLNFSNSIGVAGKSWYYSSYDKFFTYFLNYPINTVDTSFVDEKIHNEIINMPSFPNDGYIKKFNDVIVIRIS